jgi:hypothetical protein
MYTIPPDADFVKVDIISGGKSNRPIVLVLVNYEPVKWILNIPFDITISKVILVSRRNSFKSFKVPLDRVVSLKILCESV